MGAYIQVAGRLKGKAEAICQLYKAIRLDGPPKSFKDIPQTKALICVVDNGAFEAAAFCYSAREFEDFTEPSDSRPKEWLMMDKKTAEELVNLV